MTYESVIRYGHLNEIQRIHPELKLRIISKYTGEMLTYDASMNFPKLLKCSSWVKSWVFVGYVIGGTGTGIERHQKFTGHIHVLNNKNSWAKS